MSRRAAHLSGLLRELVASGWVRGVAHSKSASQGTDEARLVFSDLDVLWIRDPRPWFADASRCAL